MGNIYFVDRNNFNQQTILLVEDNEDDTFITRRAFEKAGVPNPIQVVQDGEQTIDYLLGQNNYSNRQRHPLPVIILLDLNLPKKNGLEVLEWLRQQPELRRIAVHILTASSRSLDVERASQLGANLFMIKPSKFGELVELIKAWHTLAQYQAFTTVR